MKRQKVVYYKDPLNDDFANMDIKKEHVPEDYKYIETGLIYRFFTFIFYNIIVRPIISIYIKIIHRQRFVGKRKLKKIGKQGAFIFANHTLKAGDAFIPNMVCYRKKNYIIVGAETVSIKGIRMIVKMLGAIPLAETSHGYMRYCDCLKKRVEQGSTITIYPEAHIWPYYTGIRPFLPTSFRYPVNNSCPVYSLTNVFKRRKISFLKTPRVISYIDGPFYPDDSLSEKEAAQKLRNEIFKTMTDRAKDSDYEYIRYEKAE